VAFWRTKAAIPLKRVKIEVVTMAMGNVSNFRMNRTFAKTGVFALYISEETMNDASFVRFYTISECDGQTDGQTDRQRDGRTSLLLQFQRMHDLLCYRAGKISCLSLSFLGPSPRLPTGALLLYPTGRLPSLRLLCVTPPNFKFRIRP